MINPVIVRVFHRSTTIPISGVEVSVWTELFAPLGVEGVTDNAGEVILPLFDGNYNLIFSKRYVVFNPYSLPVTIAGTTIITQVGEDIPILTSPPDMVILRGFVRTIKNEPVVGATVYCHITPQPQNTNTEVYDKNRIGTITDGTGFYSFLLRGGAKITLVIPTAQYQATGVLPLSGVVEGQFLNRLYTNT